MDQALRVYLAGPLSREHQRLRAAQFISSYGHVPVLPGLRDVYPELHRVLLQACHVVLCLRGASNGAEQAVEAAKVMGMPVYFTLRECLDDLPKRVVS
jgi:hypothetical protein